MVKKNKKLILILGATASGKSGSALKLKKKEKALIINVDSRQVYKKMSIFSGLNLEEKDNYLVEILQPEEIFSAGDFVKMVEEKIKELSLEKDTIILVGGTTFYFKSLLYKNYLPKVEPDLEYRKELESEALEDLLEELKEKDLERYNNIDKKNKPRVVRALEIIKVLGKVPGGEAILRDDFQLEIIWIKKDREEQNKLIENNFKKRIESGFLEEAKELKKYFLSLGWENKKIKERFWKLGLAYKFIFDYWEEKIDLEEFIERGILEEQKYAKRQNTFIKKFVEELKEKVDINILEN